MSTNRISQNLDQKKYEELGDKLSKQGDGRKIIGKKIDAYQKAIKHYKQSVASLLRNHSLDELDATNPAHFSILDTNLKLELSIIYCYEAIVHCTNDEALKQEYSALIVEEITNKIDWSLVTDIFDRHDLESALLRSYKILGETEKCLVQCKKIINEFPALEAFYEEDLKTNNDCSYFKKYRADKYNAILLLQQEATPASKESGNNNNTSNSSITTSNPSITEKKRKQDIEDASLAKKKQRLAEKQAKEQAAYEKALPKTAAIPSLVAEFSLIKERRELLNENHTSLSVSKKAFALAGLEESQIDLFLEGNDTENFMVDNKLDRKKLMAHATAIGIEITNLDIIATELENQPEMVKIDERNETPIDLPALARIKTLAGLAEYNPTIEKQDTNIKHVSIHSDDKNRLNEALASIQRPADSEYIALFDKMNKAFTNGIGSIFNFKINKKRAFEHLFTALKVSKELSKKEVIHSQLHLNNCHLIALYICELIDLSCTERREAILKKTQMKMEKNQIAFRNALENLAKEANLSNDNASTVTAKMVKPVYNDPVMYMLFDDFTPYNPHTDPKYVAYRNSLFPDYSSISQSSQPTSNDHNNIVQSNDIHPDLHRQAKLLAENLTEEQIDKLHKNLLHYVINKNDAVDKQAMAARMFSMSVATVKNDVKPLTFESLRKSTK